MGEGRPVPDRTRPIFESTSTFSSNIVNTESGDYRRDFGQYSSELLQSPLPSFFLSLSPFSYATAKESRKDFTLGRKVEGNVDSYVSFVESTESFCWHFFHLPICYKQKHSRVIRIVFIS